MTNMRYPLGEHERDWVRSGSGKKLDELSLEALHRDEIAPEDLAIHPDTLRAQAQIAEVNGNPQLALNLRRAAELASIPEERILAMYEALRPYRTSAETLDALARELEERWQAPVNANLVREAADAYRRCKLI